MIKFVNAKINIGLNIVRRREDGYHDLETVFFPVGLESGLPHQPEAFDDILEIVTNPSSLSGCRFQLMGRRIDCEPNQNLAIKAARKFLQKFSERTDDLDSYGMFEITLDKHLPDGAGLGGGSADAAFTLLTLNELTGEIFSRNQLLKIAQSLGADCPFFIYNTPCFAEGTGEILTPIELNLKGYHLLIVKPDVSISTKEAFAGITPRKPKFDLRFLPHLPVEKWKGMVINDFEESIFPKFPELSELKEKMYSLGAVYASMSGSGSAIYSLFKEDSVAFKARDHFRSTYSDVWLFGL